MSRLLNRATRIAPQSAENIGRPNLLLATLPDAERRGLIGRCERVELSPGDVLCEQGGRIRQIYFPTDGFISLLSDVDRHPGLEVALVGVEGAVGASLALGIEVFFTRALVQGTGSALRMEAARFLGELERSAALRTAMNRYVHVLMTQFAQMAVCTRFHVVEARLARWLLMARDRAGSDEFYVTHESIAQMLGVRRVGVTHAAGVLQRRRLVRYCRGRMTILDVRRLEGASCGCYLSVRTAYTRFMS